MPRYQRHVFICTNKRAPEDPKGCCSAKGSDEMRALFKQKLKDRGLNRIVRANSAGCLDACAFGASVVIYPEGVWYGGVTTGDIDEIIDKHVIGGVVVERLLIKGWAGGPGRLAPLELPPRPPQAAR